MKRISIVVIGAHLFLMLWMALWMPVKSVRKKPLAIRTVVPVQTSSLQQTTSSSASSGSSASITPAIEQKTKAPEKAPTPIPAKAPAKKVPAKKKIAKKAPPKKSAPKKPMVSAALAAQLQESIAKIEQKSHKGVPAGGNSLPKIVSGLQIDGGSIGGGGNYVGSLIDCLQGSLNLPEVGAVKIELKLKKDGSFIGMKVIHTVSKRNQVFLEGELPKMKYPAFDSSLKNEKEHSFVITFCNV